LYHRNRFWDWSVEAGYRTERSRKVTEGSDQGEIDLERYAERKRDALPGPGLDEEASPGKDLGNDACDERAAGTWTLTISDRAGIDTGTLNRWSLEITPAR